MKHKEEKLKGEKAMKGKYLSPKADLTFKLVFAEHKDLMMSLLNALLPLAEDAPITFIEYENPEMAPDRKDGKNSIVDVRCKDAKGRHFLVEMQMNWDEEFKKKKMAVLWLRFLTEINEDTVEAPAELLENEEISKALSIVEKSAMSEAQLYAYERFWDAVNNEHVLMEGRYKEGRAEGLAEGRAEERAKARREKLDTARKLKAFHVMTIEQIADATGLTPEEIEAL